MGPAQIRQRDLHLVKITTEPPRLTFVVLNLNPFGVYGAPGLIGHTRVPQVVGRCVMSRKRKVSDGDEDWVGKIWAFP